MKEYYYIRCSSSKYFAFIVLVSNYIDLTNNSNIMDEILVSYRGSQPSNQDQKVQTSTIPSTSSNPSSSPIIIPAILSKEASSNNQSTNLDVKYKQVSEDHGENVAKNENKPGANTLCDSGPCHPEAICITLGIN